MRKLLILAVTTAVLGVAVLALRPPRRGAQPPPPVDQAVLQAKVEKLCSTCHRLPPPDCQTRDVWPAKIRDMYGFAQADRPWPRGTIPPITQTIKYWVDRAPTAVVLPDDVRGFPPCPLPFSQHGFRFEALGPAPSISNVKFVRLSADGPVQLLISDMRDGAIAVWTPTRPEEPPRVIARLRHPSRTHLADLDQDGIQDILVADLGVFFPSDTDEGQVVWLRGRGRGEFEPIVLWEGLGRVNEARAADLDDDGDLDVLVAVFGHFNTGMIACLENFTEDPSRPDFEPYIIDSQTGTSDVPIADLNRDGLPDFVALQSQQHEEVQTFINQGRGGFQSQVIFAGPHPLWGSTGIHVVDLDGDDDLDVVLNHGDSPEVPTILRPDHGFAWLENAGQRGFVYHRLAHLPGAQSSCPGDLDGDGRLDILAGVFLAGMRLDSPDARDLETLVWMRQTEPGKFQRFVVETGQPVHACVDICDYDGDGDQDVAIGNFYMDEYHVPPDFSSVLLLENRRK